MGLILAMYEGWAFDTYFTQTVFKSLEINQVEPSNSNKTVQAKKIYELGPKLKNHDKLEYEGHNAPSQD